jgi:hypothetical protein
MLTHHASKRAERIMACILRCWLTVGGSIALFSCFSFAQGNTRSQAMPLNSIVEGLEKTQAAQFSYQVVREYRIFGANSLQPDSAVVAEVTFLPVSSKYKIQTASGSSRGVQVIRGVLDHEIAATSSDNQARIDLTRSNYDFTYLGETVVSGHPCYRLGLHPKRKEKQLISGEVWVDQQTLFVRQIEGEVAKSPSWWLKSVHVKFVFAELDGTWVQTSMEAVADVRMIGPHTLTSRMVNYQGDSEVAALTTRVQSGQGKTVTRRRDVTTR